MTQSQIRAILARNLESVQARIARAAERSGRSGADICLIVVTKYVTPQIIPELVALGCLNLGESRPQELWRKAEASRHLSIHWHLVGPLQRNKVRRTVPLVELIHSVDSLRLLEAIEHTAQQLGTSVDVLLEVNISGEKAKHGFAFAEMPQVVAELRHYPHVRVRGLMGMAGLEGGAAVWRKQFASLRQLRDDLSSFCPPGVVLHQLSMGMSGDFEVAIEEGATMVRLGTVLFEGLPPECFVHE